MVPPRTHRYADRERVFYRVAAGDSLARVASALGVSRTDLLVWNAIDESARLQPGMVLQDYLPRGTLPAKVRVIRENDARVLVAGSEQFFDYYEGLNGRRRITVVAREGDTLQSIGRRHGMSAGWMERINRRPRGQEARARRNGRGLHAAAGARAAGGRGEGRTAAPGGAAVSRSAARVERGRAGRRRGWKGTGRVLTRAVQPSSRTEKRSVPRNVSPGSRRRKPTSLTPRSARFKARFA